MPIDTSMYGNAAQNLMGGLEQGMRLGDMIGKKRQENQIKELRSKYTVTNPDGTTKFDQGGFLTEVGGINPELEHSYKKQFAESAKMDQESERDRWANIYNLASSATPENWAQVRAEAEQKGYVRPGELPEQFDPNMKTMAMGKSLSMAQRLDQQNKDRGFDLQERQIKESRDERRYLAGIARKDRLDAREEKRQDREESLAVPGYQRTGEVLPKAEEAMKLRKATANAEQLVTKLNRLKEIVNDKGSFEYGGTAGTEMDSLATEIQLLAKGEDMYALGVLTGPDLKLLEKITASPTSMDSLFTRDSTRKQQIDTQLKSIQEKLASVTKASGYAPIAKRNTPPADSASGSSAGMGLDSANAAPAPQRLKTNQIEWK